MITLIKGIFIWVLAGAISRMLAGAGIALLTYNLLDDVVENLLTQLTTILGGLPADMLTILQMSGIGEALSIIGSAMMTIASLKAAGMILGVKMS